jgi:GNAT superfamily N-acetyltransferase
MPIPKEPTPPHNPSSSSKNPGLGIPEGTPNSWELRIADYEDVAPVLEELTAHMNEQQREAFQDKLERYARKPDRDLIIATQNDRTLGIMCVIEEAEIPEGLPSSVVHFLRTFGCSTQLLVHPDARKQGVGTSLQLKGEEWARKRGRDGLWLVTRRMAYWYKRDFGYEDTARIKTKGVEKSILSKRF